MSAPLSAAEAARLAPALPDETPTHRSLLVLDGALAELQRILEGVRQ
jgi:hypothetical protein